MPNAVVRESTRRFGRVQSSVAMRRAQASTEEAKWRQNYQVWMAALREFGLKGGVIGTGDDAFTYTHTNSHRRCL